MVLQPDPVVDSASEGPPSGKSVYVVMGLGHLIFTTSSPCCAQRLSRPRLCNRIQSSIGLQVEAPRGRSVDSLCALSAAPTSVHVVWAVSPSQQVRHTKTVSSTVELVVQPDPVV